VTGPSQQSAQLLHAAQLGLERAGAMLLCSGAPAVPGAHSAIPLQGGCGAKGPALSHVAGSPAMLAVGLVWEAPAASSADIAALSGALQSSLQLGQIYPGARGSGPGRGPARLNAPPL